MEEKKIQQKRMITETGDLAEDLSEWALKLKALGGLINALAWYEKTYNNSDHLLDNSEYLGEIIKDYAEFIYAAVSNNIAEVRGLQENIGEMRATGKI
jgi:hypothetical protein